MVTTETNQEDDSPLESRTFLPPIKGMASRWSPEHYNQCVHMLIGGSTVMECSEKFQVSTNTVQHIRNRHKDVIPSPEDFRNQRMDHLVTKMHKEMLVRDFSDMSTKDLSVSAAILTDKLQAAQPAPQVQVNVNVEAVSPRELMAQLPSDKPEPNDELGVIDVEVLEHERDLNQ